MKKNVKSKKPIIKTDKKNEIRIRIPQTIFWILGVRKENKKWDAYLFDPESDYRTLIKEDATTESFARFSSVILKTPFPFEGKRAQQASVIIKLIEQLTKNI